MKAVETEVKIAIENAQRLHRMLIRVGARRTRPRELEDDVLFDLSDRSLAAAGRVLRVRSQGKSHWLTFKGPALPHPQFKIRSEMETEVSDPMAVRGILLELGFQPIFRYQKFRSQYEWRERSRRGPTLHVMLDETPIGSFLELEGPRSGMRRLASLLGFSSGDFIRSSYRSLFVEYCQKSRIPAGDMVFRKS